MLMFLQENIGSIAALLIVAFIVFLAVRRMALDKKEGIGICGQKCSNCAKMGQCETVPEKAFADNSPSCGHTCSGCKYSNVCHKQQ